MSLKIYESENELGFELTLPAYSKLLTTLDHRTGLPILKAFDSKVIRQYWLTTDGLADGTKKTRIRQITSLRNVANNIAFDVERQDKYEYTTKFYWNNGGRTELNTDVTAEEFNQIRGQYKVDEEIKTRIYLKENATGNIYTADIFTDHVRLEIEFPTTDDKAKYQIPEWLNKIIK